MTTPLTDAAQRQRIASDTGSTLFVNAGAGSGKTSSLVNRVSTLVLTEGVPLSRIAAVTFTEKAGAELRDRLRAKFEQHWRGPAGITRDRAAQALDDLDSAAIGTLHSFAQRILAEHPIEAGLPPVVDVLDEVGSSVAFEERWAELQSGLLDDDAIAESLLIAMALGADLKRLRSLALLLGKDWDLIGDRILPTAVPPVYVPSLDTFRFTVLDLLSVRAECSASDDLMNRNLEQLQGLLDRLDMAPDVESRLAALAAFGNLKASNGRAGNWPKTPVADVRQKTKDLAAAAQQISGVVLDQCLRHLANWVGTRVLESAEARRREGKLEFHDLLVLARDVLRRDAHVRESLYQKYERLLLDEFQDTDPIQIELAVRIAGGANADADDWHDVTLDPGRLFVVGDAKQSIYRFRRASIATYLSAEASIGEPASLTTNFRTIEPILRWVNTVFASLITPVADGQPDYVPLDPHRTDVGTGAAVTVLGADAHTDLPRAAAGVLRDREAADVARVLRKILADGWQVYDERSSTWRPARHDDIAILVPTRTSLPHLEEALDSSGIPYRAEASSLVYSFAEVRSLLACARAIADTSDSLSLVTALRSPVFGCGDDDLWRWKQAGGRFDIHSTVDGPVGQGAVGSALDYLRRLHYESRWRTPSEILATIIADRRMLELAATGPRSRDAWRRLRFVLDQARAWSEVSHGGLRAYLAWAAHQGQETSRVAEAVLPETDVDAVRVMTIHAAKGLEFPIVILSGMTTQRRATSGVRVLWPPSGGYEVALSNKVQTGDFQVAVPLDEQMDELERLRLLYVAATRARDHLVVSLHRDANNSHATAARVIADVDGATVAGALPFIGQAGSPPTSVPIAIAPPPPFDEWSTGLAAARSASRAITAVSASGLEGTEPEVVLEEAAEAGSAKGSRDLELPPWSKGRYGSAIGRAVHAVLQVIDLGTGAGLDAAVAAQCIAEGVVGQEALVRSLVQSALDSDLVKRAASRELWRETYVGTVQADGVTLEGYVDLIYREDDGSLVIVDYKTDSIPTGALQSRITYYRPQMQAYARCLSAATAVPVSSTLLFLHPQTAVAAGATGTRYVQLDVGGR